MLFVNPSKMKGTEPWTIPVNVILSVISSPNDTSAFDKIFPATVNPLDMETLSRKRNP